MAKNDINLKISERSKPGKSSKKKRWDIYTNNKIELQKFIKIMEPYILGKNRQLQLINNFYETIQNKQMKDVLKDYHELMQYYNQSSHLLIIDENKLFVKIGWKPTIAQHVLANEENVRINTDDSNLIWYLAGIIDAEGSICMNERYTDHSSNYRFSPVVSLTNTNKKIIQCCCSTLKNNGIGYHVQVRINPDRNRIRWDIMVSGIKRVKSLTDLLNGKLTIKNRQNELLNKYCNLRLQNLFIKNDFGSSFKESVEALNKEN